MKVAIIGCGYAGSAIARHLREKLGYMVTATTTSPERVPELEEIAQRVVVAKGDDEASLLSAVENQDAVLLSVSPIADQQVDADGYKETFLYTAKNLVTVLQQTKSVKQLIYTGSCAVYGDRNGEWVTEESPTVPGNQHGEILLETEQVLLSAETQDLKVCLLRLGAIYGPGREIKERFSRFAGTTRPGDGNNFTNWVHLDDIVSTVEFALNQQLQGIYNLVNDVPLTTRELFDRMCEVYGLPPVEWDASQPRTRSNNRRVSNHKLKEAGYKLIHRDIVV
ncbi:MAG: SDR family oxidoreductase [Nostocaceae cyanobacterium]|nr:SDR family oxidoreductase [Nostocaceae cyanobacterium]